MKLPQDSFEVLLGIFVVSFGSFQVYEIVQGKTGLLEGLFGFVFGSLLVAFILLWLSS